MSFDALPNDMRRMMIGYFEPTAYTAQEIKRSARELLIISLSIPPLRELSLTKLGNLKTLHSLTVKYPAFEEKYRYALADGESPKRIPLLLDALFTGYPNFSFPKPSFREFTPQTEADIKEIVRLMPESLHCNLGEIRCRDGLTPLAAACWNKALPLSMVQFLLSKGANPDTEYRCSGYPITILEDTYVDRHAEIKALFEQHKQPPKQLPSFDEPTKASDSEPTQPD